MPTFNGVLATEVEMSLQEASSKIAIPKIMYLGHIVYRFNITRLHSMGGGQVKNRNSPNLEMY
jgi:hypothetical protein